MTSHQCTLDHIDYLPIEKLKSRRHEDYLPIDKICHGSAVVVITTSPWQRWAAAEMALDFTP
jgi:hypothetical protein